MSRSLFVPLLVLTLGVAGFAWAQAAPTGPRLEAVIDLGLNAEPERQNKDFGTTLEAALVTDLVAAKQTVSFTQMVIVENLDGSTDLCIGSVAWSGAGADCDAKCDTAANYASGNKMNCTRGNAEMGSIVPPGKSRAFRYDGTRCVCAVASGAGTTAQIERVTR